MLSFLLSVSIALTASSLSRFDKPQHSITQPLPYTNPKAPKGGTLKLGAGGNFESLNPFYIGQLPEKMMDLLYMPLMIRSVDEPFSMYACVASSIDVAPDSSSMTIELDPNARFHDGSPVLAQDVKATVEKLKEEGLPRYAQFYGKIEKIEILDCNKLKFTLKKTEAGTYDPELPLLVLSLTRPLPAKILKTIKFISFKPPLLIPGTGPYTLKSVKMGQQIVYEKIKDHWSQKLPFFKGCYNFQTIQIDYYRDPKALFQAFLSGDIHMYFETDVKQWKEAYTSKNVDQGHIQKIEREHQQPVLIRTIIMNMKKPIFRDIRVRKALVYAFDFQTFNRLIFDNDQKQPKSLFANTELAHQKVASKEEKLLIQRACAKHGKKMEKEWFEGVFLSGLSLPHRNNLQKAQKLLKEAGFKVQDGTLHDPKGIPVALEFFVKDPKLQKVALHYQRSLKILGITLIIRLLDGPQYEEVVNQRKFDFIIHAWANSLSPGYEQGYYFNPKMADHPSSNYIGVKDPVAEELGKQISMACNRWDLIQKVRAFDRYVMFQYLQIPLMYQNKNRWAYWKDHVAFPPLNAKGTTDVVQFGWSPKGK